MNRKLRRRHRRITGFLAVALPIAFVAALALRPEPVEAPLPAEMLPAPAPEECSLFSSDDLWGALAIRTRLLGAPGSDDVRVELRAGEPLRLPDVLVYWAPAPAPSALPGGAKLLGTFAGELRLPPEARSGHGALVLYSLAHGEVVGSADLPPLAEAPPCR